MQIHTHTHTHRARVIHTRKHAHLHITSTSKLHAYTYIYANTHRARAKHTHAYTHIHASSTSNTHRKLAQETCLASGMLQARKQKSRYRYRCRGPRLRPCRWSLLCLCLSAPAALPLPKLDEAARHTMAYIDIHTYVYTTPHRTSHASVATGDST